jgi:hypothetical protein
MLTEIHRQAEESAIIRLATMARQGEPIGFGQYDTFVWKMRKMDVTPEQCLRGGQVICGLNATRLQLNNATRRAAGFGDGTAERGPSAVKSGIGRPYRGMGAAPDNDQQLGGLANRSAKFERAHSVEGNPLPTKETPRRG